jgi:aflatoxin B1 aldehyde reductase
MYNALTRAAERELFPALRDMGIAFYAYNPLAGGILTGKYRGVRDLPSAGRFTVMPHYKDRFWHPALFQALEKLRGLCEESGTAPAAAAYRWLVHHSALRPGLGDGVIVGASTLGQLRENLDMLSGDPLPQEMQDVMEECWETARCEAPEYFRYDSPK